MEDLINKKFGRLLIIKVIGRKHRRKVYECLCDCGNIKNIDSCSLVTGRTKSCGCYMKEVLSINKFPEITKDTLYDLYINKRMTIKDISYYFDVSEPTIKKRLIKYNINNIDKFINKTFYYIKVIEYIGHKGKQKLYKCICACNKIIEVTQSSLISGNTKSCGCISKKELSNRMYKGYMDISGSYWNRIKSRAKKYGLEFSITIEYIWNLFIKQNKCCALSGQNIYFAERMKLHNCCSGTASLDRIDSSLGYIEENVQWVHKDINFMKHNFKQDYFINMCKLIVERNNNVKI